jgi:NAD(P)-dependent dehydrogenase (short-subunit alcohol dehydrogenase family)
MVKITGYGTAVSPSCRCWRPSNKLRPAPSTLPRPQIVTTSSVGAFNRVPLSGFAYTASKAFVVHLMKSMSTLLGNFDIRCNVIAPGLYYTEISAPAFKQWRIEMATRANSIVTSLQLRDQGTKKISQVSSCDFAAKPAHTSMAMSWLQMVECWASCPRQTGSHLGPEFAGSP